jgi:glutathione synthase/RimK-type ligase-like ATP-grasp enzyme
MTSSLLKRLSKSMFYSRMRQYFPMPEDQIIDDRSSLCNSEFLRIEWPKDLPKPNVGLIQDKGPDPYWTRYARFLENNSIPFKFYSIHDHDWLEKSKPFDVIIGKPASASFELEEFQEKVFILENHLKKNCFPGFKETILYENKKIESYLSEIYGFPFIHTYISYEKKDAIELLERMNFPCVSKIVPGSGSIGVELVLSKTKAKRIIDSAFSLNGRKGYVLYSRQKNYVYFQDFIQNDGYDMRVIVVGKKVFGFYRKTIKGDFRASGMKLEEKRELPIEAMKIARKLNMVINCPFLVVDMLHGKDGNFYINEISPFCGISTQDELQVNGVPGAYVFDTEEEYHFEPVNYWLHEAILLEYFENYYLPQARYTFFQTGT